MITKSNSNHSDVQGAISNEFKSHASLDNNLDSDGKDRTTDVAELSIAEKLLILACLLFSWALIVTLFNI